MSKKLLLSAAIALAFFGNFYADNNGKLPIPKVSYPPKSSMSFNLYGLNSPPLAAYK